MKNIDRGTGPQSLREILPLLLAPLGSLETDRLKAGLGLRQLKLPFPEVTPSQHAASQQATNEKNT